MKKTLPYILQKYFKDIKLNKTWCEGFSGDNTFKKAASGYILTASEVLLGLLLGLEECEFEL